MKNRYILFISILVFTFACKPELDEFTPSAGNANFSTYVALGNSLTAGYADGSLYRSGQMNSFPNILAEQFMKAGGGAFKQPLLDGEYGILPGKLKLGYATDCLGNTSLSPVPDIGTLDPIAPTYTQVNNMGVPGSKSFHLLAPGYGDPAGLLTHTANPYFVRFADGPGSTVLQDAMALNPTFFTLWIGNNDVLGYATSGGMGDSITGQQSFAFFLNSILGGITANEAKGAIANIPDITDVPFFTTIPSMGYVLNQGQADTLNLFLGQFGFTYQAGPNPFIIEDTASQLGFRQMKQGELLLLTLPQDSLKCAFWGGFNPYLLLPVPIPGQYVLTLDEIAKINTAVEGYNQTIKMLADQFGLAYVDANSSLKDLKDGIIQDGVTLTSELVTGNAFSLDGIHLTPMGYAYTANQFIMAINAKFGANIPMVSIAAYQSVVLP